MQLNQLEILSYVTIIHQPVTVTIAQTHAAKHTYVQINLIKHSVAHLQDLIPTLAGKRYISNNTSQSKN